MDNRRNGLLSPIGNKRDKRKGKRPVGNCDCCHHAATGGCSVKDALKHFGLLELNPISHHSKCGISLSFEYHVLVNELANGFDLFEFLNGRDHFFGALLVDQLGVDSLATGPRGLPRRIGRSSHLLSTFSSHRHSSGTVDRSLCRAPGRSKRSSGNAVVHPR